MFTNDNSVEWRPHLGVVQVNPRKLPILQALVERYVRGGVDLNQFATFGGAPTFVLVRAAYVGLDSVVGLLLENGASVNVVAGSTPATFESAISAAVQQGTNDTLNMSMVSLPVGLILGLALRLSTTQN